MRLDGSTESEILLFCAFRYALGRHSYVVSSISDTIKENWPYMEEVTKEKYRKEIREYLDNLNWNIDCDTWAAILNLK